MRKNRYALLTKTLPYQRPGTGSEQMTMNPPQPFSSLPASGLFSHDLPKTMKPESFEDHDRRPIVLIDYEQHGKLWMPHSVFVSHAPDHPLYCSTFDFNWSKTTGGLYYHESGSGSGPYINGWPGAKRTNAKLWWDQVAAPKLKTGGGEEVGVADLVGLGFDLVADPIDLGDHETNPFIYGIEGDVIYCTKCRDHLPESDVCEHVFWCEKCQEWGGAEGNKEHCRHRKPTLG